MLERNLRTSAAVIKSFVERYCHCSKCNLGDLERNSSGEPIIHLVAQKLGCVQTYDELDMFVPTLYPQNESDFASLTAELEERQKTVAKSDADDDGPHETPQKPQRSEDMEERVREMQVTARMSVGAGLYQDQKRQQQQEQQQQQQHHHHRLEHQQSNASELLFYQPYSDENKICQGAEMTDVYGMYEYETDFDLLPNTGIYI